MGVCNNKRDTFQPKRQAPADGGGEPLLEGVFCLCKKTYLMTPNHVMERLTLALLCLLMLGTQDAKCQKFGFKDRTAPDSIGTLRSVCVHSLGIEVGGGIGSLLYDLDGQRAKLGYGVDARVVYRFHPQGRACGLTTGVDFGTLGAKSKQNMQELTPEAVDKDGESYCHISTFEDWEEEVRCRMLSVPLMFNVVFGGKGGHRVGWEASVGPSISIVLGQKIDYEATGGRLTTSGYYAQYNVTLAEAPVNGFYTLGAKDVAGGKGEAKVGAIGVNAGAEVAVRLALRDNVWLRTAVYGHYGIVGLEPSGTDLLPRQYDADCQRSDGYVQTAYHSALCTPKCSDIHPLMVGVRIGMEFGLRNRMERRATKKLVAKSAPKSERIDTQNDTQNNTPNVIVNDQPADIIATEMPQEAELQPTNEPDEDVQNVQRIIDSLWNVTYEVSSTGLNSEQEIALDSIASVLKRHAELKVTVTGHTCNTGSEAKNQEIGMLRARTVMEALTQRGVEAERLRAVSCGSREPIASNDTAEGRRKNRRSKIEVSLM